MAPVAGSEPADEPCTDLRHEFQRAGLHVFLTNDDLWVRYCLISLLSHRTDENPPVLRPMVTEVLRVARSYLDHTLTERIRGGT